jgi:hypothetical protein
MAIASSIASVPHVATLTMIAFSDIHCGAGKIAHL